ncbi:hypothetical protein QAD02_006457 [Eretmocerus hayati]|uniref:Uncharacterized protein n=1 Tax=Eretmocerus hayati TaxID=131215 RepID=A0ACC2N0X6_9HYME|nr:hypothetical protein QAD02_006457 [Eretmocerus hayati]
MFPTDPHYNDTFFPYGIGQLTNAGKRRMFEFGMLLRERYSSQLGSYYNHSLVMARSTDYERTKMSLQLVLASLYPPQKEQIWNPQLNWQPIPTVYVPRNQDSLLNALDCEEFIDEEEKVHHLPEVSSKIEQFRDFMNQLSELTGKNISKPINMYRIYHLLISEAAMNLTLPSWAKEMFPNGILYNGTILAYEIMNYNEQLKKLNGGRFLYTVMNTMKDIEKNASDENLRVHLYSGHENNVAAVLQALDVYEPHVPEYSSSVIIEVHELNSELYIKVLHYRGIPSVFDIKQVPGCEELCPFNKFTKLLEGSIPSDNELNCTMNF